MSNLSDTVPGQLMKGLIYPAFVGAGFVWTFQAVALAITAGWQAVDSVTVIRIYLCVWLLVYFSTSFVLLATARDYKKPFTWGTFSADMLDIFIVFMVFRALGVVSTLPDGGLPAPDFMMAYLAIGAIPIAAGLSRWSVGARPRYSLSVACIALAVVMAFTWQFAPGHYTGLFALAVLLFLYFRQVRTPPAAEPVASGTPGSVT